MSRVASNPITIPSGVEVKLADRQVAVKGPKGQLEFALHQFVDIEIESNQIKVIKKEKIGNISGSRNAALISADAIAGTTRAILQNHVTGVSKGYERKLLMVGVGYRAQAQGNKLNISAGFSHPVVFELPSGITVETPTQTEIVIRGADKQVVGQVAANIRAVRPPESYKGKGIRYSDEKVIIKETKKK